MSRKHRKAHVKDNRQQQSKADKYLSLAIEHEETAAQFASAMDDCSTREQRYILYRRGMMEAIIMLECLELAQQ